MEQEVVVIGAGVSGLAVAAGLGRMGIDRFLVLEKSDRLGGTWRDNHYPGCACDIPSHLYSFSWAPNPDWSRMFASQAEILAYLERTAKAHGLAPKIRFQSEVAEAHWEARAGRWRIVLRSGETIRSRLLVAATGILHHPQIPKIQGLDTFEGMVFHTAGWRHDHDLSGRRVAVIGAGASAIQVVPAIVDRVRQLFLFQRTPPWIAPRFDRPFDEKTRRRLRFVPFYRLWLRSRLFWIHELRAKGFLTDPSTMARIENLCRGLLERQVKDETLRARLTPNYAVGCKRLLISSDWYPAITRPNVELIDSGIAKIGPQAIITTDGEAHPVDTIIFATGFDAQNLLSHLPIRNGEGRSLFAHWQEMGMRAMLGTTVAGFPNFFLMTGPNSGLGHNSQIFMIEAQVRYIMDCLRRMRRLRATVAEVRSEAQDAFNVELDERMAHTVWKTGGCRSWYLDPATGRNTLLWPMTSIAYWRRTRKIQARDYSFTRAVG
ncbi:MAG: flavin-containing monooxygenase [Stellaceae bacterium]